MYLTSAHILILSRQRGLSQVDVFRYNCFYSAVLKTLKGRIVCGIGASHQSTHFQINRRVQLRGSQFCGPQSCKLFKNNCIFAPEKLILSGR